MYFYLLIEVKSWLKITPRQRCRAEVAASESREKGMDLQPSRPGIALFFMFSYYNSLGMEENEWLMIWGTYTRVPTPGMGGPRKST